MKDFKWYLLYYNDEGVLRCMEFDLKGQMAAYIEALPEDFVVAMRIYGKSDRKRG